MRAYLLSGIFSGQCGKFFAVVPDPCLIGFLRGADRGAQLGKEGDEIGLQDRADHLAECLFALLITAAS